MLIHDLDITVIDRDSGEILRELVLNPDKDSQPRGLKPGLICVKDSGQSLGLIPSCSQAAAAALR